MCLRITLFQTSCKVAACRAATDDQLSLTWHKSTTESNPTTVSSVETVCMWMSVRGAELSFQHHRHAHTHTHPSVSAQSKNTALHKPHTKTTSTDSTQTRHHSPGFTSPPPVHSIHLWHVLLITGTAQTLLAYLPSIAMMFLFGFNQSGRWRRGSGPLSGWGRGVADGVVQSMRTRGAWSWLSETSAVLISHVLFTAERNYSAQLITAYSSAIKYSFMWHMLYPLNRLQHIYFECLLLL